MALQVERHKRRFDADPGDRAAFEVLEEHHFLHGAWGELCTLYEQRLAAPALADEPGERARLHLRLGQVLEERCGSPDSAMEHYRRAMELDPGLRAPVRQLRRLHATRGQWEVALQLAEVEAGTRMRPYERASLLVETALLWQERLGDAGTAAECCRRALEEVPDHLDALVGLARALEAQRDPAAAAQAWAAATERLRGPDRAPALVARARALHALGRPDEALALHREAVEEEPTCREAIDALCSHARAHGCWAELAELLERRFAATRGASRRGALALDAARLHLERLEDPEAASVWLERAAELVPDDPSVMLLRAETARRLGRPHEQARQLETALALADAAPREPAPVPTLETDEPARAPSAQLSGASGAAACEDPPGSGEPDLSTAGGGPSEAAADAPSTDDPENLETLARALQVTGRDDELAEVLERLVATAGSDPAEQAERLVRLGEHHEQRRHDLEAACDAYERARRLAPEQPGLAEALDRVLGKLGRDARRVELMEEAVARAPEAERPALQCALGELRLDALGDAEGARKAFEAALRARPGLDRALAGLARLGAVTGDTAALLRAWENEARATRDPERLAALVREIVRAREARGEIELARPWAERWVESAPRDERALALLVHVLEELGETEDLVALLERRDGVLTGRERAANRRRLGFLHAAEGRLAEAAAAWRRALELDPDDVSCLESLREVLEQDARHVEQAAVERRLAELLPRAQQAACWDRLAELHAGPLGDVRAAIEAVERATDLDGETPERGALLETLLRRAGRFEALLVRLDARAAALPADSPERAAVDRERARLLLDELERPGEAAALLREQLLASPDDDALLADLERAAAASGDAEARLTCIEARLARTRDDGARASLELERALVLEEELDRPDEARTLLAALAEGPDDLAAVHEARARLERLYEREGDAAGLCTEIERRIVRAPGAERVALHVRAARLAREGVGDAARARYHLEAATRADPRCAEAWRELAVLHEAADDPAALLDALEGELAAGPDAARERALRARAAALCLGPLARPERAADHYTRLLDLDPAHDDALAFVCRGLEEAGDAAALVARLEAAVEATPEDERVALRLRIAHLRMGSLDDAAGARAQLEAARREAGPLPTLAAPLAELYEQADELGPLATLCREVAAGSEDPAERGAWLARLGHVLRRTGEPAAAAEAFRGALRERPEDGAVRAALRELLRELDDVASLARLLEDDLRRAVGNDEVTLRAELAALCEERLERPAEALAHHRRLLEIEPGDAARLARAVALARRLQRPEEAVALVDRALSQPALPSHRAAALWAQRGELLRESGGRDEEAIASLRRALELDPGLAAVRRELRAQLERAGRWTETLELLDDEISRTADREARRALLEHGAAMARAHLGGEVARRWLCALAAHEPERLEPRLALVELLRESGPPEALERALAAAAERMPAGPERRDLCIERGRLLLDALQAPVRARAAFEEAYHLDPAHPSTGAALVALYETTGRDRELVGVLEELAERAGGREGASLLVRAALLRVERLGEPERAAEQLAAASADTSLPRGARIELLRALGEAWRACARTEAWAEAAEAELALLDPESPVFAERRRTLQRELACVLADELGRPRAAATHLRALLDEPGDPAATQPPAAGRDRAELEARLITILRAHGSPVELARRIEVRLEHTPDDVEGWVELARLREERLWAPAAAALAWQRALALDPGRTEALRGLRRCAERAGDWPTVARALEQEVERAGDAGSAERAALWRRLGQVYEVHLAETARASRAYQAALDADPTDRAALRALQSLAEAMEDWSGAVALYRRELEEIGDGEADRRRELWLRIAELARTHLADVATACDALAEADALAPLGVTHRAIWAHLLKSAGDLAGHAEILESWCDDPEAEARGSDHVRLARVLEELGRTEQAMERLERAVAHDPGCVESWRALAEAHERRGAPAAAAQAWERVGELDEGPQAGVAWLRAAQHVAAHDPARAADLVLRAAEADPTRIEAHALLARTAAGAGRPQQALAAAGRVLELHDGGAALASEELVETALVGARAAAATERIEPLLRFADAALAAAPGQAEALALRAEARLRAGDRVGARADLELLLEDRREDDPDRPHALALLGRVLERDGELEEALARFEESAALDARCEPAQHGRVRVLEALERTIEAARAARDWAGCAHDDAERARRLVHGASLAEQEEDRELAEALAREATEAAPELTAAWETVARLLVETGRMDDALEITARALENVASGPGQTPLLELRARALEEAGRAREAAEAFRRVAERTPAASRAALAAARLLRAQGDWRGAAEVLREAAQRHPDAREPLAGARLRVQLGRLLAGPLEDIEGAIAAYREALDLAPDHGEAREALARLLVHRPALWDEAVARHLELLDEDPGRAASIRALVQIARGRGLAGLERGGLAILRALGAAAGEELAGAPATLPFAVAPRPALDRPECEALRRALVEAAPALSEALGASRGPVAGDEADPLARFRSTRLAAEAELSAAALMPLGNRDFAETVAALVHLAHEPDTAHGDGHVLNALSGPVGRRLRRRLRRTLDALDPAALASMDLTAWRAALRSLAAAVAVDRCEGDLRSALCATIAEERPDHSGAALPPEADLTPWIAECPGARRLLARVLRTWSAPVRRAGERHG